MVVVTQIVAGLGNRCRRLSLGTDGLLKVMVLAREHRVGLELQELSPRRPDATGRRSEAALAEHSGDGGPG